MNPRSPEQAPARTGKPRGKWILAAIIIFLLLGGAGLDGFFWEPNHPRAEIYQFPSWKRPKGEKPLRLIQISDLHLKEFGPREEGVVKIINDNHPDLILMTGDYLEQKSGMPAFKKFISLLPSSTLKVAVLGNLDHQVGISEPEWAQFFSASGVTLLINSRITLPFGSGQIRIIGFDDPSTGRYDLSAVKNLSAAEFNLLLAHSPEIYHLVQYRRIDLLLAGHTHGGQVRLPLIPPLWLPRDTRKYSSGFYRKGRVPMYVSRGIGTAILPVRFLCPPEVAIFIVLGSGLKF